MKHAIKHIHFVGIGGAGMSGIAEVLHNLNYKISGSDIADSQTLQRISNLGIKTYIGHAAQNIQGADAVVVSTAIGGENEEVREAKSKKIPVVPRALMLAELMRLKQGIAIAGTHGKTTTTSLVASVLAKAGLDPTFVIGGKLNSAGVNARLGAGEHIVVEADESDASFLNLLPTMAVITNIDADHMETYGHDFSKLKKAFVDFLHRMPFYGAAILCTESQAVCEILGDVTCPVTTYGFDEKAQIRAVDIKAKGSQMSFKVIRENGVKLPDMQITLNLAGRHNVLNALAAICVAMELEIDDEHIKKALEEFSGVGRRFQNWGEIEKEGGQITIMDDYGHHPVEMRATLAAARGAFEGRQIILAFQPHRYSRTRDCFEEFIEVLSAADKVVLAEVYAAGEEPIIAADSKALARALRVAGKVEPIYVPEIKEMPQTLLDHAKAGDVILCMGAGSIGAVPAQILELHKNH